ncbi:chitin-binding protein [Ktedonosporobacter rubrisoli]|uniref:Chitin-binding protein n=1 Tax=Ktedonosporobacter rubrisoli TaxID=2509675 RepID=A0A4P6JIA4_KTERU|nr:lytic polysaccharide monooxygenase [Ktedonosporobacter rubrisoli]QBD74785.1 chitin-binding protein [Ktedonosporobacter rubrisoli]
MAASLAFIIKKRWALICVVFLIVTSVLVLPEIASPVQAHGAMSVPISRVYGCFLEGPEHPTTPACQYAVSVGGTQPLYDWNEVHLLNANGQSRQLIPDGHLCSAGTTKYAVFDTPRTDWPSTNVQAGVPYTFQYRATAPHRGTFDLYITKDGYDPTQPLKWSDLEDQPFLSATDPPLVNGVYQMQGTMPAGKTGHHLIYSIWQRSDSPEAFYTCSDVIFGGSGPTPTPTPVPPTGSCKANVNIDSSWQSGYQATITVQNTGTAAVDDWMVDWTMPAGVTITSGWNATVSQDGTMGMAKAPSWARTLDAGASVSIGFNATGSSSPPPSGVVLDGISCT